MYFFLHYIFAGDGKPTRWAVLWDILKAITEQIALFSVRCCRENINGKPHGLLGVYAYNAGKCHPMPSVCGVLRVCCGMDKDFCTSRIPVSAFKF